MTEEFVIAATRTPSTRESLAADLSRAGLQPGRVVIVHSSLRSMGYVIGGPVTVVLALLDVLGTAGTLVMPTFSGDNSEPSLWRHPPVPERWWPAIRDHLPAYDPRVSPTRQMGRIVDVFLSFPGVVRSAHPQVSCAALGSEAAFLTADHALERGFGEGSPFARVYELDGSVLLLGVDHGNNSSLHLSEHRAGCSPAVTQGSAMTVDGRREWRTFEDIDFDSADFAELGAEFDVAAGVELTKVGLAETRFVRQRPLVDFGVEWLRRNRKAPGDAS